MLTIKKISNHKETIKYGVVKGFEDRDRAFCDTQYLQNELENIEEVFLENGFDKWEIWISLKPREIRDKTGEREREERCGNGLPNIPNFTQKFNKEATKHNSTRLIKQAIKWEIPLQGQKLR